MYGWIIDQDHLAEPGDEPGTNMNAVGVVGPRRITGVMEAVLRQRLSVADNWQVLTFEMWDDDRELYYTGRLLSDDAYNDSHRPLEDYGTPNAGAVAITYAGHPEMDA